MNKKTVLQKLAEKTKLNEDQIKDIIYYNHAIDNLFSKKDLKEITLNFNPESIKLVKKIAKLLKVSDDAVINAAISNHLELKNESN